MINCNGVRCHCWTTADPTSTAAFATWTTWWIRFKFRFLTGSSAFFSAKDKHDYIKMRIRTTKKPQKPSFFSLFDDLLIATFKRIHKRNLFFSRAFFDVVVVRIRIGMESRFRKALTSLLSQTQPASNLDPSHCKLQSVTTQQCLLLGDPKKLTAEIMEFVHLEPQVSCSAFPVIHICNIPRKLHRLFSSQWLLRLWIRLTKPCFCKRWLIQIHKFSKFS